MQKQHENLKKYEAIIDVMAEVERLKNDAEDKAKEIIDSAEKIAHDSKDSSKRTRERADGLLVEATENAKKILSEANVRAQEIAGEAIEAKKNADLYENTAKAMKNIIEGYGDLYLVPTVTLIDNLAEEYGHTQAGEDLKRVRGQVKQCVKGGMASTCKYVEENRKQTAVNFVLDAFNGKVDSVLADVKAENFGTLSQKINDAFQTVNFNGKAFRDAEITSEYLKLRLEELKLACTVQALKDKDREEQRVIRDQIREEEKAKRDFDRAIKEAEKEESLLNKALDKARKELEGSNAEERSKFEAKIAELETQLKQQAEDKQRALSMAQQTRSGHVYIISNIGSFGEQVYKIGLTRRLDPQDRIDELSSASVPFDFDVHAIVPSEDAPALETNLHKKFIFSRVNKVNPRKEYFKVDIAEIRKVVEEMGISVKWTIAAEARAYYESKKIEADLQAKLMNPESWKAAVSKEIEKSIQDDEDLKTGS